MQVVLLERIEKLGLMGDVVNVRDGYARNYLLPQKKALRATDKNIAYFESQRAQLEARNLELRKEAEAVGAKIDGTKIVIVRQASENDQLYGSVTMRDVAQGLIEAGFTVDKSQVALDTPIKSIGIFPVRIVLHPEVSITVSVNVARSEQEAKAQQIASEETLLEEAESMFESEELAQHAVEVLSEDENTETEAEEESTDAEGEPEKE